MKAYSEVASLEPITLVASNLCARRAAMFIPCFGALRRPAVYANEADGLSD